jgi:HEPN domain-containing protein
MDEATREEVDRWLIKARRDLDSARRLLEGDPPYRDTAAYHCQQAAEKGLKAYLTAISRPFPKTHDLTVLLKLAESGAPDLAQLASAAIVLTPYATLFRYPDSLLEPSDEDLREALAMAGEVLQVVSAIL